MRASLPTSAPGRGTEPGAFVADLGGRDKLEVMTQLPRHLFSLAGGLRGAAGRGESSSRGGDGSDRPRDIDAGPAQTAIVVTLAKVTGGFVALLGALAVAHGAGELLGAF